MRYAGTTGEETEAQELLAESLVADEAATRRARTRRRRQVRGPRAPAAQPLPRGGVVAVLGAPAGGERGGEGGAPRLAAVTDRRDDAGDQALVGVAHPAASGAPPGSARNRRPAPVPRLGAGLRSSVLRDLRRGLRIEGHLGPDTLVRVARDDVEAVDDHRGVDDRAPELLILLESGDLSRGPVEQRAPTQGGVRAQQDEVERLDPAVLLHAAVEADRLVEDLDGALLATADGHPPSDEQHSIGHTAPFVPGPASDAGPDPPTLSPRLRPGNPARCACPRPLLPRCAVAFLARILREGERPGQGRGALTSA